MYKFKYFKTIILSVILLNIFLLQINYTYAAEETKIDSKSDQVVNNPTESLDQYSGEYKPLQNSIQYKGVFSGGETADGKGKGIGITDLLCDPEEGVSDGSGLSNCINRLYRTGAVLASIATIFLIAIAGYFYIVGSEQGKSRAKKIIYSSLAGLVIIFSSYSILNTINPTLTTFRTIQPPSITAGALPSCSSAGFGEYCIIPGGGVGTGDGKGGYVPGKASGDMKQWHDLITKYTKQYSEDYCSLYALIAQESAYGKQYIYSNPMGYINPSNPNKKTYGLDWSAAADYHAIGLGQITIYTPGRNEYKNDPWPDTSTPSRGGKEFGLSGKRLTVTDLINPETNISAGAYHFYEVKIPFAQSNSKYSHLTKYQGGYAAYHGGINTNGGKNVVKPYQQKFDACKAGTK